MDLSYTNWRERAVNDSGMVCKWQLIDTGIEADHVLVTLVQLPNTVVRAYYSPTVTPASHRSIIDYPSVPEARTAVERRLAAL